MNKIDGIVNNLDQILHNLSLEINNSIDELVNKQREIISQLNKETDKTLGHLHVTQHKKIYRYIKSFKKTCQQGVKKKAESISITTIRNKELSHFDGQGADIRTPQGKKAELLQAKIHACLVSNAARKTELTIENVSTNQLRAYDFFNRILDSMGSIVPALDLNEASHCKFLNELAGLLHKSYNAEIGGVGSFNNLEMWNSEWSEIGNNASSFSPQNTENDQIKERFFAMLDYYKTQSSEHFSEQRHIAGRELAHVQTLSVLGQMLHDFIFNNKDFDQNLRQSVLDLLINSGIIQESPEILLKMRSKMRQNPLLAEVENFELIRNIGEALKGGGKRDEIEELIFTNLKDYMEQTTSTEVIQAISTAITDEFIEKVEGIEPRAFITGSRGRLPFNRNETSLKNMGKTLSGDAGNKHALAIQPHRGNDAYSTQFVKSTLGTHDRKVIDYFDSVEGEQNILKHGGSPLPPLRVGKGLDGNIADVMSVEIHLKNAILEVNKHYQSSKLEKFARNLTSEKFKTDYAEIVGGIELTFNSATRQQITLQEFSKLPSASSIMYNNNVRMICSISGTTVDIILGLASMIGKDEVENVLRPLIQYIESGDETVLESKEGIKFKALFSAVSTFMQAGQYHTAGEVLGGLFIASRAFVCTDEENIAIQDTFRQYEKLIQDFSKHPERYFDINQSDKNKILREASAFLDGLREIEFQRISEQQKTHRSLFV